MIGAIAGDVIGSVFEWNSTKSVEFDLFHPEATFTDDSVLTFAIARAILDAHPKRPTNSAYGKSLRDFGNRYPGRGYGGNFQRWLHSARPRAYNSFGNGSGMRVSPIGLAWDKDSVVLREAEKSAAPTHNHEEGIKGAQAVALGVLLARTGASKDQIRAELAGRFRYDLARTVESIRPAYVFDVTCQGSVPEAIIAFLDSSSYESAVRNAISLGGDADTQACIAGAIAGAYYDVPPGVISETRSRLPAEFLRILEEFERAFPARERGQTTLPGG